MPEPLFEVTLEPAGGSPTGPILIRAPPAARCDGPVDVAKLNGLLVDRSESVGVTHTITDKPMPEDEWAAGYGAEGSHEEGCRTHLCANWITGEK